MAIFIDAWHATFKLELTRSMLRFSIERKREREWLFADWLKSTLS
jgi:hypothetical protein